MTLDQLRVFVVVADTQHVTRAAHTLNLAQSAVSKMIATLEGEVGFRLFDRVGRNIRLTNAGAAYRDEACMVLAAVNRLTGWANAQRDRMAVARARKPLPPTQLKHESIRSLCTQGRKPLGARIDPEARSIGSFQNNVHFVGSREEV